MEHHLFPRIPRHNLRLARPLVQQFASENKLEMHSYGFIKSNYFVLGVLKDVADQISVLINGPGCAIKIKPKTI